MTSLRKRRNNKGTLSELFKGDFKQCNFLEMKKGSDWGGHYHKLTRESFYIASGEVVVVLLDLNNTSSAKETKRTFHGGDSFSIETNTIHRIHAVKDTTCVVLYSEEFNELEPDIYK